MSPAVMHPPILLPSYNTVMSLSHNVYLKLCIKQCCHVEAFHLPIMSACNISPSTVTISWIYVSPQCLLATCPSDVVFLQHNISSCDVAILWCNIVYPLCHWYLPLWHLPTTARFPPEAWHLMVQGISPYTISPQRGMTSHGSRQCLTPLQWHLKAWDFVSLCNNSTCEEQFLMVHHLPHNIII